MVQFTPNFNLAKPELADSVDIDVLNGNMDIVDSALATAPTSVGFEATFLLMGA